jgi:hypothetical protein
MKKTIVFLVLLWLPYLASAQNEKTNLLQKQNFTTSVELGLNYSSGNLGLVFNPQLGYYLNNRLEIGADGEFNFISPDNFGVYGGIYSKYYFLDKKFSPFIEIGDGFLYQFQETSNTNNDFSTNVFYGGLGLKYQISKRFSLETKYEQKYFFNSKNSDGSFSVGFKIKL